MPFQVVELKVDADDKVIDRKAIPYPYPQRLDAVETIEKLITRLQRRITKPSATTGQRSPKTEKRGSNLSSKACKRWV